MCEIFEKESNIDSLDSLIRLIHHNEDVCSAFVLEYNSILMQIKNIKQSELDQRSK